MLLYMPAAATGQLCKLASPHRGPYRIMDISSTIVYVIPENKPKFKPKCVAWNHIMRLDCLPQISHLRRLTATMTLKHKGSRCNHGNQTM